MKRSNRLYISASLVFVSWLGISATAAAEAFWIDAPVVDVQPLVRIVEVTVPQEVCWEETVREAGFHRRESHTPKIVGGIIGGVVGNKFGGGRGQDIMTIAGALLGASIGNDVARQRRAGYPGHVRTENRCEIEHVTHEEERIDGYRVTYEYAGREFMTRRETDPGSTIRIRVNVEPVSYNWQPMSGHSQGWGPDHRQRQET